MAAPALDLLLLAILDVAVGSSRDHGNLGRPYQKSWPRTQGPQVSPGLYALSTSLPPMDLVSLSVNSLGQGPG